MPRGFGKDDGARVKADITENEPTSFFYRNSISVSVPRLHDDLDALPGDEGEEERLFGAVSEDGDCYNDEDTISECGGEDYYDEDSGMLNVTLKNNVAVQVLIDKEINASTKIVDYYSSGNVFNSSLKDECLLIAIYVHHMYLTQPNNFKRIMSRDDGWLSPHIMDKLNDLVKCLENEFGQNVNGRGHWDEVALMRKLCACDIDDDHITLLKDRPKLAISQIRRDNSSNRLDSYFTYILKHSINNKNRYRIGKLFSHGDKGVFSNDKPCILSLKDKHFYNIWGYDFLFNDIDTPKIGSKQTCGSSPQYKKLFCLHCMVSYSSDSLHICCGRCHCCLGTDEDHVRRGDSREFFCNDCGRAFLQVSCYEGHKAKKLHGEYESYCDFLCTLHNCDECRKDFGLSIKCRHFGKK